MTPPPPAPLRLGLVGAGGRMGRAIAAVAAAEGAVVAGGAGRDGNLAALAAGCDVLVDFSHAAALPAILAAAVAAERPLLVGTTGHLPAHAALLGPAAARIALLPAANTSFGVAVLRRLVADAARALGPDWDVEVLDVHHRHKRDAPSGTARLLGEAAAAARGGAATRVGHPADAVRAPGDIHYAALRGGSVAGDHLVLFAGEGERIELVHRAEGRDTFARGAVRAAAWLRGRAPGRYTMDDVLGLP